MYFDFACSQAEETPSPVCVKQIYLIHADPTYHVSRAGDPANVSVVLFTFGGHGILELRDGSRYERIPFSLRGCVI